MAGAGDEAGLVRAEELDQMGKILRLTDPSGIEGLVDYFHHLWNAGERRNQRGVHKARICGVDAHLGTVLDGGDLAESVHACLGCAVSGIEFEPIF